MKLLASPFNVDRASRGSGIAMCGLAGPVVASTPPLRHGLPMCLHHSTYFESGICPATSLLDELHCIMRADPGLCRAMYREINLRILHRLIPNLLPINLVGSRCWLPPVHDRTSCDLDTLTIATLGYLKLFLQSPLLLTVLVEPSAILLSKCSAAIVASKSTRTTLLEQRNAVEDPTFSTP
jgi:hypothetical protein